MQPYQILEYLVRIILFSDPQVKLILRSTMEPHLLHEEFLYGKEYQNAAKIGHSFIFVVRYQCHLDHDAQNLTDLISKFTIGPFLGPG